MPHPTRPQAMRVDEARCTDCELCYLIAPVIRRDPQHIPIHGDTLEAMAQCPTGALVWREEDLTQESLQGFAPSAGTQVLDIRPLAPRERHATIKSAFDALVPGEAFELVSDHDPQPLHRQFQVERGKQVGWDILEEGPDIWRVKIGRI